MKNYKKYQPKWILIIIYYQIGFLHTGQSWLFAFQTSIQDLWKEWEHCKIYLSLTKSSIQIMHSSFVSKFEN